MKIYYTLNAIWALSLGLLLYAVLTPVELPHRGGEYPSSIQRTIRTAVGAYYYDHHTFPQSLDAIYEEKYLLGDKAYVKGFLIETSGTQCLITVDPNAKFTLPYKREILSLKVLDGNLIESRSGE